ncbi:MAG: hypothetical protein ACJASX_003592 [Limisphaerales bacterium]|jgi:hypothetical protein
MAGKNISISGTGSLPESFLSADIFAHPIFAIKRSMNPARRLEESFG